jgi:chaperone BCS1
MGIPHALGLLFYGSPGTGKTSAIKAIAKYMNMNVVIIPMNTIRTRADLEQVFYTPYYGGESIPYDKRIYVFEEIDCNGWEDIVINRKDKVNLSDMLANVKTEDDMKKYMLLKKEEDAKLNLGAILELLDGIIEVPGRMIIITTNHPEKLDPAIKRPGRIDMQIEFKKLRRQHIADIYEKWCGHSMKQTTMNKLPDYCFSQAELAPYLFKYQGNPSAFIDAIIRDSSSK